jgi:hypothetical protein
MTMAGSLNGWVAASNSRAHIRHSGQPFAEDLRIQFGNHKCEPCDVSHGLPFCSSRPTCCLSAITLKTPDEGIFDFRNQRLTDPHLGTAQNAAQ